VAHQWAIQVQQLLYGLIDLL